MEKLLNILIPSRRRRAQILETLRGQIAESVANRRRLKAQQEQEAIRAKWDGATFTFNPRGEAKATRMLNRWDTMTEASFAAMLRGDVQNTVVQL